MIWIGLVTLAGSLALGRSEAHATSWMDHAQPASWNQPGLPIPTAPEVEGNTDPRCKAQARPPQTAEDKRVRERGWDLSGGYQGGWQLLVIGGAAGYDGMCRPLQYQYFVFTRGRFVGTLSPHPMDSRTDGALSRVYLQNDRQVTVEYLRYSPTDPLCCASATTTVVFVFADEVMRPVSSYTSKH
jgi:hypothetical protein